VLKGSAPVKLDVGPTQIDAAFTAIAEGKGVDLQGISGALDYDLQTGTVVSQIQVYCILKQGTLSFEPSGLHYDPVSTQVVGTFSSSCL
jgi:hypothetical protein